jgi:DNA-binding MarR family transcriptional regulator
MGGLDSQIDRIRRFERVYEAHLRRSRRAVATEDFSVADTRVLHELWFAAGGGSAAWLAYRLDMDTGYLCRILKKLQAFGLVTSRPSADDRRMRDWELTKWGGEFAEGIEKEFRDRARSAFAALRPDEQRRLVDALPVIEEVLSRDAMRSALRGR